MPAVDWASEYRSLLLQESKDTTTTTDDDTETHRAIAVAALLRRFREAVELLARQVIDDLALPADLRRVSALPLDDADDDVLGVNDSIAMSSLPVHKVSMNGLVAFVARAEDSADALAPHASSNSSSTTSRHSQPRTSTDALQAVVVHKRMGHQLRAARTIHDAIDRCDSDCAGSLCVPLQGTVDYLGFRCLVFASASSSSSRASAANTSSALTHELSRVFDALGLMTERLDAASAANVETDAFPPPFAPKSLQCVARAAAAASTDSATRPPLELHNLFDVFPADVSAARELHGASLLQQTELACSKFRPEFVRLYGDVLLLHANAHPPPQHEHECAFEAQEQANDDDEDDALRGRVSRHEALEAHLLQQAALSASEFLQCEVVPAFVRALEDNAVDAIDSRSLTTALHGAGINARYLGRCFSLATAAHVRRLLMSEMVARVCKLELRAALRATVLELGAASGMMEGDDSTRSGDNTSDPVSLESDDERRDLKCLRHSRDDGSEEKDHEEHRWDRNETPSQAVGPAAARVLVHCHASAVAVEFFSLVLGAGALETRRFWRDRILPHVRLKFGLGDSADATTLQSLDAMLRDGTVHLPQLFHALQTHANVAFCDRTSYAFESPEPFTLDDLALPIHMSAHTTLAIRTTTHCEDALASVDALVALEQLDDALAGLKLHVATLDTAPSDARARALTHLLASAAELSLRLDRLDDAARLAAAAVESSPRSHAVSVRAHTVSMQVEHAHGDVDSVRAHYEQAVAAAQWHLGAAHPVLLDTHVLMIAILSERGDADSVSEALQVTAQCLAMVRACVGRASLAYADVRRTQGHLLSRRESLTPAHRDEAASVLEDAVSVYERHFRDDSLVTDASESVAAVSKAHAATCCYLIAELCADSRSSPSSRSRSEVERAYAAAQRALTLRDEVLPPHHVDLTHSHLQLGALALELGDAFRARESLTRALTGLKHSSSTSDSADAAAQIQSVTQTLLRLHLASLSTDHARVVERTRRQFASLMETLASEEDTTLSPQLQSVESSACDPQADAEPTKTTAPDLLAFAVARLLRQDDVSAYVDELLDAADDELRTHRTQQFALASPLRHASAEAPSPLSKWRLQSPSTRSARFASFSGVSRAAPSSSVASPRVSLQDMDASAMRTLVVPTPPASTSAHDSDLSRSVHPVESSSVLTTRSGEFTSSAQLAALLFLVGAR